MKKLFIALGVLVLLASVASASVETATPTTEITGPNRANTLFYYEDMDSGAPGWYSVDLTMGASPKFHITTYMTNNHYVLVSWHYLSLFIN